jgi:type I restriction enzyme S subunit
MVDSWTNAKLEDLLDYVQPTKYIVSSIEYSDEYKTPVLTAGKSFIIGYTNETNNHFDRVPVIIFDDFTTSIQFVNFHFKVKSSAMKILVPTSNLIDIRYVFYLMKTLKVNTVTHKRYWISVFSQLPIKVASFSEQKIIADQIEEMLSDLDNAIENLKKAQEQLKVYRLVLLNSAFKGELTNGWRKNKKNLTSPDDLIERIKQQRENVNDSNYGKRHRKIDLSYTDINKPPYELPSQWVWCRIKDLIFDLTDYHANGSYESLKANVVLLDLPNYALMIRATNFEKNDFTAVAKYITQEAYEFLSRSKLFGGEILIGKIGNAGKVYFMPFLNKPTSLAMNLFALRFSIINPKYVYYHLISPFSDKDIASYVKGVGNPTIDKTSIRSILIALPSLEEQKVIIQEIESRFSICDMLEKSITDNLEKAESLRQSILKQAFEGKLTEQWRKEHKDLISGENSAEALLKKIKTEKEILEVK